MGEIAENPKFSRKLAGILAADIADYSALMSSDEARTVRDLKAHQAVVLPMIAEHSGRIIDTAGDGILAEFASVVNAVEFAVAIQKTMAERNTTVDPARRLQFRIGVNLGDVIHDDARVYDDGVNIAARLEAIAEPGGICLSGEASGRYKEDCRSPQSTSATSSSRTLSSQYVSTASTPHLHRALSRQDRHSAFPTSHRSPSFPSPT
jgi:class 3 adenylate cyclase